MRSTLPVHHFLHLVSFLLPVVRLALWSGLLLNLWLKESGELLNLVLICVKSGRKKADFAQGRALPRFVRYSVVTVLLTVVFRLRSLPTCPLQHLPSELKVELGLEGPRFAFVRQKLSLSDLGDRCRSLDRQTLRWAPATSSESLLSTWDRVFRS